MSLATNLQAADSGNASDTYARAHPTCKATGLNSYALVKAAAMGAIRTKATPTGATVFNLADARHVAQHGTRG